MADEAGEGFGYFLALLVLICGLPTALLLLGVLRKKRGNRFETKLGEAALQSTRDRRRAFVLRQVEEMNNSLQNRTSKLLKIDSLTAAGETVGGAEDDYEQHSLRVFQAGLLQGRSYWGIGDILVKDGALISRGDVACSLPPGLFEDFLFTAFNKTNPLPLVFGDDRNPESMLIRFTVYCTAQAFTLILFLSFYENYTSASILLTPLVVLCEHWLRLTLFCPCLSKGRDIQDENDDEDTNQKLRRYSGLAFRNGVRFLGGLLAAPLLLLLLVILILLAMKLAKHSIPGAHLGQFLWTGILSPFLLKLLLLSVEYLTAVYPTFISMCGIRLLEVNRWTQSQRHDGRLNHLSSLSSEERALAEDEERRKMMNEVELCHCGCYCLSYSHVEDQYHSNLACCQPTGYIRDSNICCSAYSLCVMGGEGDTVTPVVAVESPVSGEGQCVASLVNSTAREGAYEPILPPTSRSDALVNDKV